MAKYIVTVEITKREHYEVEASDADEAMDNWGEGQHLDQLDHCLESEPLYATLSELPEDQR